MIPEHRRSSSPGEVLFEEFIKPKELTELELAKIMDVTEQDIIDIVNEEIRITNDIAIKLAKALNTSPEFWITLQVNRDLWVKEQRINLNDSI